MSDHAQRVQLGPFFDGGVLQGGAKLYHYAAGQSVGSPKDIWEDRGMVTALPNPIIADQDGVFNFFADGGYKIVVCKADSATPSDLVLYEWDNFWFLDPTDNLMTKGDSVQSASTTPIGPEVWMHILGSNPIAAFAGTIPFFWGVFDGDPLLQHSSSLLLPDSRNRKMKAGDVAFFLLEGDSVYRMASHMEKEATYGGRQGASVATSGTIAVPADGDFIQITGNDQDITAIATASAGYRFTVMFMGSGNQFIHNATSLICPYGKDYRTVTNEVITFRSLGSGNWVMQERSGPSLWPGAVVDMVSTAADDGCVLLNGQVLNATRYAALAKKCIPAAGALGTSGTSLGTATFVAATDLWTLNAHGLSAGDIVQLTNAGGALPSGFTAATVYYVINPTTNTFQLSLTRGGATVDGTTAGTGTQTVHNKFQVPDVRGMTRIALDNLGGAAASRITSASVNGANATTLGGVGGAQTHTMTLTEMPSHTHNIPDASSPSGGVVGVDTWINNGTTSNGGGNSGSAGGGGAHSNTQPWMALGSQMRW